MMPADLAGHLLAPDDEVLLAPPGIPDDTPRIMLVTRGEVILGRWNAQGAAPRNLTRRRAVAAPDVRGASYRPGLYYKVEIDVRAARDRALLATTSLWNCEEVHSGPALGWLYPGEHTLLVLLGQTGVSTEYLAVTDRRVLRGSAPGARVKERPATDVREAVFDEGRFKDAVRIEMHDGSSLTLDGGLHPLEGREFVDALNTLIATGSLPTELLPFR